MLDQDSVRGPKRRLSQPQIVSVAVHLLILLAVAGVFHRSPRIAPYKFPGTAQGVQLLTYYAAGSRKAATSELVAKAPEKAKLAAPVHVGASQAKPAEVQLSRAETGSSNAAQSGLGDGDISIAVMKYFPHPAPDLSALPHGTKGDIILNAVIDEHGKISELTLLKGFGPPVDDEVIAVVRQWTYNPAIKNGSPVPSEQELHFHYERG
jgi:protein TonB